MPVADGDGHRLEDMSLAVGGPFEAGRIDAAEPHPLAPAVDDVRPGNLQRERHRRRWPWSWASPTAAAERDRGTRPTPDAINGRIMERTPTMARLES